MLRLGVIGYGGRIRGIIHDYCCRRLLRWSLAWCVMTVTGRSSPFDSRCSFCSANHTSDPP